MKSSDNLIKFIGSYETATGEPVRESISGYIHLELHKIHSSNTS